MRIIKRICETCEHFDPSDESIADGLCRLNPPIGQLTDVGKVCLWSEVFRESWCSHWEINNDKEVTG